MQNLQNIPGETDLDIPMPGEISPGEKKPDDLPLPTDKIPSAPIEEPNEETPINENPREPQRIMRCLADSQRRIF